LERKIMTTLENPGQAPTGETSSLDQVTEKYQRPDLYLPPSEIDSPWVPWTEGTWLRHIQFDVRQNTWAQILRVAPGAQLGRHRHRGTVDGVVLSGSWGYREYDWTATAGGYVHESPGVIHTLFSDEGMETFFFVGGTLEFYDDDDNLTGTNDVFWYIDHYLNHCKKHNLKVNEELFL